MLIMVAILLIHLTGPDGRHRVYINPSEVSSLREPNMVNKGHWANGTHCVVIMANGRFNAVREACDVVRHLIGSGGQQGEAPCTLVCGTNER